MGRRSDHARDQIHDMILKGAAEIVVEGGLRSLNIRQVAARIGYSVGTIYNLFRNQDDVIVHMNGRTLDDLYGALAATPAKPTTKASLEALADTYLRFTHDHANRWNALFEHALPEGEDLPPWYDAKITRLLGLVEARLEPLFGPRRKRQRVQAAQVLWCGLHGIGSLASSGKLGLVSDRSVAELSYVFIRTYLAGLEAVRASRRR